MTMRQICRKLLRHIMQFWFRWRRSMTIGVRALVIEGGERLLLVRPRYSDGWTLPGGGVERGETAVEALARELQEEASITVKGAPKLLGVYSHEREFRGDHVIVYLIKDFEPGTFAPNFEIVEARFFNVKNLPAGVTAGTRRRIDEFVHNHAPAAFW
jgi:ADP-ribose pyrophosphatase YjhB (NUDIX family)